MITLPLHLNHGTIIKKLRKHLTVQCRTSDNQFQASFSCDNGLLDQREQNIRIERPLMRLVQNDHIILAQQRITETLSDQNSISHIPQLSIPTRFIIEPDRVAHQVAQFTLTFETDSLSHRNRGHSARLRDYDFQRRGQGRTRIGQLGAGKQRRTEFRRVKDVLR
jgi:hypothetical protein